MKAVPCEFLAEGLALSGCAARPSRPRCPVGPNCRRRCRWSACWRSELWPPWHQWRSRPTDGYLEWIEKVTENSDGSLRKNKTKMDTVFHVEKVIVTVHLQKVNTVTDLWLNTRVSNASQTHYEHKHSSWPIVESAPGDVSIFLWFSCIICADFVCVCFLLFPQCLHLSLHEFHHSLSCCLLLLYTYFSAFAPLLLVKMKMSAVVLNWVISVRM